MATANNMSWMEHLNNLSKENIDPSESTIIRNFVQGLKFHCERDVEQIGEYKEFGSIGFTLAQSKDHECLIALIDKNQWVTINVSQNVTCFYYNSETDKTIKFKYGTQFVLNRTPSLVYLVLFLWELYHENGVQCLDYLLKQHKYKPFTTHHIFGNSSWFRPRSTIRYPTTYKTLEACCNTYNNAMEEGDYSFSTELLNFNAWDIRTGEDARHHAYASKTAHREYQSILQNLKNINVPTLAASVHHLTFHYRHLGYFLIEDAMIRDRADIAVWSYCNFPMDVKVLEQIASRSKYNSVVEFIYSLCK